MNMREALGQAIDALTERGDAKDLKAVKKLQPRRDALQLKADTRAAEIEDFRHQELTMDPADVLAIFRGKQCACGKPKSVNTAFCLARCWPTLPPRIRKACHTHQLGDGFEQAYEAGINFLAEKNENETSEPHF